MANSIVKVSDILPKRDGVVVFVGLDGEVIPSKHTIESSLNYKKGKTNIRLMQMDKGDKDSIDLVFDNLTYVPDMTEEDNARISISAFEAMDELAYIIRVIDMDHDYSKSPKSQKTKVDDITVCQLNDELTTVTVKTPEQSLKSKEKPLVVQQILDEFDDKIGEGDEASAEREKDDDSSLNSSSDSITKRMKRRRKSSVKNDEKKQKLDASKIKESKTKTQAESDQQVREIEKEKALLEKKSVKKEKKSPKPMPNDFALFSTPDIIRRVEKDTPTTPDGSSVERSDQTSPKSKPDRERKLTVESDPKSVVDERMKPIILQNIQLKEGNSDFLFMDRLPTPSDVRSIIMTEDVKSYTTCTLPQIQTSEVSSSEASTAPEITNPLLSMTMEHTPATIPASSATVPKTVTTPPVTLPLTQTIVPTAQVSVPSAGSSIVNHTSTGIGLDLDQSILDNITTDEISEDILYKVAQSLVSNTDLQKAIDTTLIEGSLVLDTPVQGSNAAQPVQEIQTQIDPKTVGKQIVRPGGRIVVLPPIERPSTRSSNRQRNEEVRKPPVKPLDEEHVSGNELDELDEDGANTTVAQEDDDDEDYEEEEEDESEDDPNKLWCLCSRPHNNRFMICCDTCEEWYHGKCVNITKAMGQQMEDEGREWICMFCKDPSLKRPQAAARRVRKALRASTDSRASSTQKSTTSSTSTPKVAAATPPSSKVNAKVSNSATAGTPTSAGRVSCVVCRKPSRENSIYCSQKCILAHASGVDRIVVFERSTGRMLSGNKAPSSANLEEWLKSHPTFEVYRSGGKIVTSKVQQRQPSSTNYTQSKLKIVKNVEDRGVSLEIRKKGIKVGLLKHKPKLNTSMEDEVKASKSPQPKNSIRQFSSPPMKTGELTSPKAKVPPTTPTTSKPKLIQTKIKTQPAEKPQPVKTPKARAVEQQQPTASKHPEIIRENVQKTLFEQLSNRLKSDNTIKLSEDEVKEVSKEIELQLYQCFGGIGQKYRNKYRSLIFNIKDTKNQTLWKRICEKKINAYQLVRLSPDDLASQELALWREREAKHTLDMIKKSELELLNLSRQYLLKTHKGEQVVDAEDRDSEKIDNSEVIRTLTEDKIDDNNPKEKDNLKKSSSKSSRRDRNKKSGKRSNKEKKRHRSSSKDRSSDKKRSRSRDRNKKSTSSSSSSHKSSRYKKDETLSHISSTEKLDKKSKEILEQLVDNKIVPPLEDRLWRHVGQDDIIPNRAESDSDHEPSSTVTIPTPPPTVEAEDQTSQQADNKCAKEDLSLPRSASPVTPPKKGTHQIWSGTINMIDVANLSVTAHEVSGDCTDLDEQLPKNLEIVGRIPFETVWDYIGKMKCSNSKTISLVRLNAMDVVEKMPYIALYSYLSSRKRLGVVKSNSKAIKDFYILPLAAQKPIPQALLPINGPGFEESRPALLLGIVVRDKRKRSIMESSILTQAKKPRIMSPFPQTPTNPPRSYTPPTILTPPGSAVMDLKVDSAKSKEIDDGDEPYSPEDSDPDNSTTLPTPPAFLDVTSVPAPLGLSSYPYTNVIPGLDVAPSLPSDSQELQKQMDELNKKIEAQKSEISHISKNIVSTSAEIGQSALANIALPSNLQQILDSIKTISADNSTPGEVPVVEKPTDPNLTIPLMLPKKFTRPPSVTDMDFQSNTIPLNLPVKGKVKTVDTHALPGIFTPEDHVFGEGELKQDVAITDNSLPMQQKKSRFEEEMFDIGPPIPGIDN